MTAPNTTLESTIQQRNARIFAIITLLIYGVSLVSNIVLVATNGIYAGLAPLRWVYVAIIFIGAFAWNRIVHGDVRLGVWILIAGYFLSSAATSVFISDIGLLVSSFVALMIWQFSIRTLPSTDHRVAGGVAVAAIILTTLIDFLGPTSRLIAPVGTVLSAAIFFTMLAVAGFILLRNYRQFGLQAKFITAVTALAVIAIIITTVIVSRITAQALTSNFGSDLKVIAQAEANTLGELMGRQVQTLTTFALNPIVVEYALDTNETLFAGTSRSERESILRQTERQWQEGDSALRDGILNSPASETLRTFQRTFPEFASILITDRRGALVATTSPVDQFDYSQEIWWQFAYSDTRGEVYISEPGFDELAKINAVVIAIPIYDDERRVIGIMRSTYILSDMLGTVFRDFQLGETGHIDSIFGNKVLEISANDIAFEELEFGQGEFLEILNSTFVVREFEDTRNFISIARISSESNIAAINRLDWFIIVHQEESEILSLVASQQQIQTIIGIFIVILGTIAASYVGGLVTKPILDLAATAQRVAAGDFGARANVNTGDELTTLAQAFNDMASQIEASVETLERRVNERTQSLSTSLDISRTISSIADVDVMLAELVEQLRQAFNYYHVHVYLWDADQRRLQLANASGGIGEQLLARNHSLALDQGLVGRAAMAKVTILARDVSLDPQWTPNELLPDTQSEIAVPILIEDEVLGVIDVQDAIVNRLTDEDAELLRAIASQTAVALRNAQNYRRAQQRAEREADINLIRAKIQATGDIGAAVKVAVQELERALQSAETSIVIDPDAEQTQQYAGHLTPRLLNRNGHSHE